MKRSSRQTCEKLLGEMQDLQERFGLFFETKRFSSTLNLVDKIVAFQKYLEESEKLSEEVKVLKEKLVPPEEQRLLGKLEEQYDGAKEMALEFSPDCEIPSKELVIEKIRALGIEKLREIAKFGQPILLMTPSTSIAEKQKVLNKKKHYRE